MACIPRGVGLGMPIYASHAANAELLDVEGKRYIDFAGGIAVLNVGHRHPQVMARVARQLDLVTHTSFMATPYEVYQSSSLGQAIRESVRQRWSSAKDYRVNVRVNYLVVREQWLRR